MTTIAFSGNLTAPLELRYTQSGKAVGNATVAVNRKRGDNEETDFYRVTLWEGLAENASNLDKGTRVVVIGRLVSREFEDRDGNKRLAWEVTADAFGPDLRFATAQVTRSQGGSGGKSVPAASDQSGDVWQTPGQYNDETPF